MDYEKTLKNCLLTLTLTLAHPEKPRDKTWLVKFIVPYAICSTIALVILYNIYYETVNKNISKACENGILYLSYGGVTINYITLLRHRASFKKIIVIMRRDLEEFKELPEQEQMIVKEYSKKQKLVWKQWLVLCIFAVLMFHIQSTASMVYYFLIGDFKLVPLFNLRYPLFIEDRKDNLVVYLMTYVSLTCFGVYAGTSYLAISPLGPVTMLHACLRLELIQKQLRNLYSEEQSGVNERLKKIARDLQVTYSFVELIARCFTLYYELSLKLSTFTIPVTLYQLLELARRREFNLEFTTFIFSGTTISAFPCYYGDMLMKKGEEVRLAAYLCGWEAQYYRRVRSSLLLILIRTSRPIAIRTMFRTISLVALSEMFQLAFRIFNLMKAALD